MKRILVIGAGKSTASLIEYLLAGAEQGGWQVAVADASLPLAQMRINNHPRGEAIVLNAEDDIRRMREISQSDLVVSMLPAHMHLRVARDCIGLRRPLVTASYVSSEIDQLHQEALEGGVTIMMEMGVDPGIDHMSAMQLIDKVKRSGNEILLFESFTGGLIAPESDNNPWHYKFTWNPRNVVLAGQGGAAKFIQEGKYKYIPYHQLFRRTELIEIDKWGRFEGYANRDSLSYRKRYGLEDIPTFYRGTLRRPGFSRAWDVFVKLGATDDAYVMDGTEEMTHRDFINSFLAYNPTDSVELKLMHYLNIPQDSEVMDKLKWLGLFSHEKVGLSSATPAQVLQHILEKKWTLDPGDKDMVVMWHKLGWREPNGSKRMMTSSMVVTGDDEVHTAMSKTVGLPAGIAARLILQGVINTPGIVRPIHKDIYSPVLSELKEHDISFAEEEIEARFY